MTAPPSKATEFAAVLLSLDDGATHSELTESLQGLVARVRDTGKAGTLTLTITVAPGEPESFERWLVRVVEIWGAPDGSSGSCSTAPETC